MKFYQELTLLPDAESSPYFLWGKVYKQLHIAFVDVQDKHQINGIGVGFPDYHFDENGKEKPTLGLKLRIFANTESDLNTLNVFKWLYRFSDYVKIEDIKAVPENVQSYAIFKRHHAKNLQKVAQNFADFKGIDFQAALKHCETHKAQPKNYPFIELKSETTGQNFKLSIAKKTLTEAQNGTFSSYGLGACVPDF